MCGALGVQSSIQSILLHTRECERNHWFIDASIPKCVRLLESTKVSRIFSVTKYRIAHINILRFRILTKWIRTIRHYIDFLWIRWCSLGAPHVKLFNEFPDVSCTKQNRSIFRRAFFFPPQSPAFQRNGYLGNGRALLMKFTRRTLLSEIICVPNISVACVNRNCSVNANTRVNADESGMDVCVCVCRSWSAAACTWLNFYSPGKLISEASGKIFSFSLMLMRVAVAFWTCECRLCITKCTSHASMAGWLSPGSWYINNAYVVYRTPSHRPLCPSDMPFYHTLRVYALNTDIKHSATLYPMSFAHTLFVFCHVNPLQLEQCVTDSEIFRQHNTRFQ